jgi:integrase
MRLNARTITGLKLPSGKSEKIYWDSELKGFGFRLRGEGGGRTSRTFITQYRAKGRTRRQTIGDYETLTFEQARTAANVILAKVRLGEDPQGEKQRQRLGAARSLRAVIDSYLASKAGQLRPASLREAHRYLVGGYFRALHPAAVTDITRADIATRLNAIIQHNGPIVARAARAALSAFFVWAWKQGIVEQNPVEGTEDPNPGESRSRVLKDAELAAIWQACGDDDYGKIIRLLMLTACRRDEIGGLQWNEVNKDEVTITLPAERVKNKHPHTLTLPPLAQRIIDSITKRDGRDSLFGDRSSAGFTAWSAAKADLDQRLKGKVGDWRLHDLRRTVATIMADSPPDKEHRERRGLGIKPHVVEAVLNHQSGHKAGVAGIYNRATYEPEVRNALAVWADHLQSIISGSKRKVVAFPQRGG